MANNEQILETPEPDGHDAGYRVADIMVKRMREYVPDVAVKVEPALMRRWSKDAETKLNASGRLIPYEDAA